MERKMNRTLFSQRFNRELIALGFPEETREKVAAIVKVFGVKTHLANAMIFGQLLPSHEQLEHIAQILEVCPKWLSGASDRKKSYNQKEVVEAIED